MAQTTTQPQKRTFGDVMKDAKKKMKEAIKKAKTAFKETKAACKHAQEVGYTSGRSDYDKLTSKKPIVRQSAKQSYGKALTDRAKKDKLDKKIQTGRKK